MVLARGSQLAVHVQRVRRASLSIDNGKISRSLYEPRFTALDISLPSLPPPPPPFHTPLDSRGRVPRTLTTYGYFSIDTSKVSPCSYLCRIRNTRPLPLPLPPPTRLPERSVVVAADAEELWSPLLRAQSCYRLTLSNNNDDNGYLERLTRTGSRRLHIL